MGACFGIGIIIILMIVLKKKHTKNKQICLLRAGLHRGSDPNKINSAESTSKAALPWAVHRAPVSHMTQTSRSGPDLQFSSLLPWVPTPSSPHPSRTLFPPPSGPASESLLPVRCCPPLRSAPLRWIHAQLISPSSAMQNSHQKEHLYKILVIGDLGVGKTSIIKRYVHHNFSPNYRATIGVDFALKVLNWDQETVRLQLWDIAGTDWPRQQWRNVLKMGNIY